MLDRDLVETCYHLYSHTINSSIAIGNYQLQETVCERHTTSKLSLLSLALPAKHGQINERLYLYHKTTVSIALRMQTVTKQKQAAKISGREK